MVSRNRQIPGYRHGWQGAERDVSRAGGDLKKSTSTSLPTMPLAETPGPVRRGGGQVVAEGIVPIRKVAADERKLVFCVWHTGTAFAPLRNVHGVAGNP